MQETMTRQPVAGYKGAVAEGLYDSLSRAAQENIEFGQAVVESLDGLSIRKPLANQFIITLSADLASGHTFDGSLKHRQLDSTDFTNVELTAVAYATSHAATMTAIAAQITTDVGADKVAVVANATARTLTITAVEGYEIKEGTTAFSVAGGGAPTLTLNLTTTDLIVGIAKHIHKEHVSLNAEDAKWEKGDMVAVVTKGRLWGITEDAADTSKTAYVRYQDGTTYKRGDLRASAGSPVVAMALANAKFRGSASADGLIKFELNNP